MWVCGCVVKEDIATVFFLSQLRLRKHLSYIVHLATIRLEELSLCSIPARASVGYLKVKGPQYEIKLAWWYGIICPVLPG